MLLYYIIMLYHLSIDNYFSSFLHLICGKMIVTKHELNCEATCTKNQNKANPRPALPGDPHHVAWPIRQAGDRQPGAAGVPRGRVADRKGAQEFPPAGQRQDGDAAGVRSGLSAVKVTPLVTGFVMDGKDRKNFAR